MLVTSIVLVLLLIGALLILDGGLLGIGAVVLAVHGLATLITIGVVLKRTGWSWSSIGFRRPERSLAHMMWQLPAGLAAAIAVQLIFAAVLDLEPQDNEEILGNIPAITPLWVVLLLTGVAVLAPLWEEAVFRGVILDGLSRRSVSLGVLASAALFALLHAGIHSGTPFLFTMGVVLALLTRFYRSVWGSVILHMVNNAVVIAAVITS